jgi:hypothetical protein
VAPGALLNAIDARDHFTVAGRPVLLFVKPALLFCSEAGQIKKPAR